jgi:hypothetical protein
MTNAELNAMPWTASLMTTDELFEWLASRKGAARVIDIESCELGQWKSSAADPYGVLEMSLEDFGTKWFVRSPESRGWIAAANLPDDKYTAMMGRVARYVLATAQAA